MKTTKHCFNLSTLNQMWSRGHKVRGQGHKKKSEAKPKDSSSEDKPSRGQGQEYSRPRPRTKDTSASVLQKKGLKNFFQAISKREKQKRFLQIFREVAGVFLHNFKNEQIPTIVGTDSNAHYTI